MNAILQAGFTLVKLPRPEILPLSLLLKTAKGTVERLNSPIRSLFEPVNTQPPVISRDVKLPASLKGLQKLDLKTEANLSFLEGLLKIFGSSVAADFTLENKGSINFQLNNAVTDFLDIVLLDAFIQDAALNTKATSILERLKKDDLYVVTEIIKAKSFTLSEEGSTGISAGAEGKLPATVDAGVNVDSKKENAWSIENADDVYCTIAVKAFQILYDKPSIFSSRKPGFRIREADDLKIMKGEEDYPGIPLTNDIASFKDAAL